MVDPADVGRVDLGGDQRQQRQPDRDDAADREQHRAPAGAQRDQQPDAPRCRPRRRRSSGCRGRAPRPAPRAPGRAPSRVRSERAKKSSESGAEEDQQRVGARLLRVPDQHRVDGDDRRRDQAGAPARQFAADEVGDRDGGGAEQRRERAQARLRRCRTPSPSPRRARSREAGSTRWLSPRAACG